MTTSLPTITIGISFYNAEMTLLDAVRSVFAQSHQDWELILLDDGSTDRSLELARSIKDPRVRVYSDGQNRRLAARLNEIVELASYDFIARMDADDLMARDRIRTELKILVEDEDCDLVSTGVLSLSDDNVPVGRRCVDLTHKVTPRALLLSRHGIVHASIIARKDWYQRNKYNESLPMAEDKSLWISAYSKGDLRVRFVLEPLYYYREDSSASAEKLLRAYRIGRQIIRTDAGSNFSISDRTFAYYRSCFQSIAIYFLLLIGKMDLIRARRSQSSMSESERGEFVEEIVEIRGIDLPFK